ncbi:unnamed protein product [Prorocentrum cordatum]|uniref:Uncharacterized protein n=1 Tax=Prorocentrum cordatum TaxID=2364126 RepID=A0ABN9WYY8_9DINO|nr:unnamed protein product [Polarella glacialis]
MLGCLLGPAATLSEQRNAALANWRQRAISAAATLLDPTKLLHECQTKMVAALSYNAQIFALPAPLFNDEQLVLTRPIRSSGSSMRRCGLFNLFEFGLPVTDPLQACAPASRMRAVASTLSSWRTVAARARDHRAP